MSITALPPGRRAASVATAAAALAFAAPPSALAADAVFGGSTNAGEAIVVKADKKAKKLKSIAVAWEARCDDGMRFPLAVELKPVKGEPGFTPGFRDLLLSRNAKGRFAGTQLATSDMGASVAAVVATYSGKLRGGRASGSLDAQVTILDAASGETQQACRTGAVQWSATRAPGRVYGGMTSQQEPVVVRLDAARRKITDLLVGWESSTCEPPENYLRFGERFTGFPVKAGRFGGAFEQPVGMADGGKSVFAYELAGNVARKAARGTVRVRVTRRDAAGITMMTCDSGAISWSTATG